MWTCVSNKTEKTEKQANYLTMANENNYSEDTYIKLDTSSVFTKAVIYNNPAWDLGLQSEIRESNNSKIFNMDKDYCYTKKCICPCSGLFHNWHSTEGINIYKAFNNCKHVIFTDGKSFLQHLYYNQGEFYHAMDK